MQNIVITGCSSGIGLECAKYLKEKGLKVYPTARCDSDVKMLKTIGFENALSLILIIMKRYKR
jgi:NADP-dependent 3-hydroxy acid dehydrogenase YdfG